jgi:peptidoglycan/xylan/chitin deacetylase (PgdA/CDA1 family)
MQKGLFVISLDFELLWGVRDKRTIETYGSNIRSVRQVIPSLLNLFERYNINATFATVGFLFAQNKEQLLSFVPNEKPKYCVPKYSPYESGYLSLVGNSELHDIYHYAASLIKMIQESPKQEIASHTFSHYYCLEGASLLSFEEDLNAAKFIATASGVTLKTIVFPRNQYSNDHIAICRKLGFIAYRGNEASCIYDPRKSEEHNKAIRATRLADSYLNLTGHHTHSIKATDGMVNVPASRFLRPYSKRLNWVEEIRLSRIKNSMTYAAKCAEAYHLWWHPHNFGANLNENLAFLESILKHYRMLNQEFGMESKTLGNIAEQTLRCHAI